MLSNQSIDLKTLLTDLHDEKAEIISGGMKKRDPAEWLAAPTNPYPPHDPFTTFTS
ncbi:hypothetical protein [Acaryochloris sp. IP29b_bin.148]|uniref:hypothetical protein n=1 Tax=Acaryochloris sp. IP29b_bin.148 TaxID=2969218 RepID=UPI00263A21E3|nr:hypothetical protein [Acaryochloris sp. IP29b_bin.148]